MSTGYLEMLLTLHVPGKCTIEVLETGEIILTTLSDDAATLDVSLEDIKVCIEERNDASRIFTR